MLYAFDILALDGEDFGGVGPDERRDAGHAPRPSR
jgi:hypothetical protein